MLTDDEILDLVRECDLDWHAGFSIGDDENRYAKLARAIEAALAAAPQGEPVAVYNPWRESLENCISGDNYLRASEYRSLIEELDDLYRLRPAAQPQGEVVVTRNESGVIVLVSRQDDEGNILSIIAESAPATQPSAEPTVSKDAYDGAREDLAIWTKRALAAEELNRKFAAVVNGPTFMGEPVQPSAEPTTECTTCGATVVRVTGVYDYPPPGDELVQAARDALRLLDQYAARDDITHIAGIVDVPVALRRALDALEAKGGGR